MASFRLWRGLFRCLAWSLVLSLLSLVAHGLPLLPGPAYLAAPIEAVSTLVCAFDLPALLLWPAAVLPLGMAVRLGVTHPAPRWREGLCTGLFLVGSWPGVAWCHQQVSQQWLRPQAIRTVVQRGQVVVVALARYRQLHHRFPASLTELVPVQLPRVPSPGLVGVTAFAYNTAPDNARYELLGINFPEPFILPGYKTRLFYSLLKVAAQDGTSSSPSMQAVAAAGWYLTTYTPVPVLRGPIFEHDTLRRTDLLP